MQAATHTPHKRKHPHTHINQFKSAPGPVSKLYQDALLRPTPDKARSVPAYAIIETSRVKRPR